MAIRKLPKVTVAMMLLVLQACTGVPEGANVVQPFHVSQYMGQWHEVARLDNRFERGLTRVTAQYTLQDDGRIQVINRGFNPETNAWQQAEGVARFVSDDAKNAQRAELEVSFFGPFYASYNVVKLSADYQYALVMGKDTEYAWLLSKTDQPASAVCQAFFDEAMRLGIDRQHWLQLIPCQRDNEPAVDVSPSKN